MLFKELDGLEARGVDTSRLIVSGSAHIIAPYNRTLDKVTERFLGKRKIGTTGRGIGPTYADKMNRIGIRVQDLFDEGILRQKVEAALAVKNQVLVKIYNTRAVDVDLVVAELLSYAARLRPMVRDTALELEKALNAGSNVLLEAGQATLLDVDHGTYPFVTSSSATAGGACTGSGIPDSGVARHRDPQGLHDARGEGPFPTELFDDDGETLRKTGVEYGTTTGRPRRCGWMDTVIGRYATRINGVTDFVITKLDVLTGFEQVPICVAYDVEGVRFDEMPMGQSDFHHAKKPIYEPHGRLVGGHLGVSHLRGPACRCSGLCAASRGAHRRAGVRHRCRPGAARDHRTIPLLDALNPNFCVTRKLGVDAEIAVRQDKFRVTQKLGCAGGGPTSGARRG